MILYHFTSRYHLPLILEQGLYKGDVPLSRNLSTLAVNLTTDGRAHRQKYNRTSQFYYQGNMHKLDKAEIRITVGIEETNPLLCHWPKFTQKMNMEKAWLDHLHSKADDNGESWYLYFGTINVDQFKVIEINSNGNGKWKVLNEMPELVTNELKFMSGGELEGNKIERIPQDEFIKYYLNTTAFSDSFKQLLDQSYHHDYDYVKLYAELHDKISK